MNETLENEKINKYWDENFPKNEKGIRKRR